MSNHLITAAYKANLRTPMRKAVMVLLADKASDDGSGIWASKQTMADELCCSKQTIIDTIKGFIAEGLLIESGHRKSPNGFTVQYQIIVASLNAVPLVKCHADQRKYQSERLTGQPAGPVNEADGTGQPAGPKPSETPLPQKATPSSGKRASKSKPTLVSSNFLPIVSTDSITGKAMAAWPPGELEEQVEHFIDHHTTHGTLSLDWQASWRTWVKNWNKFNGNRSQRRMDGQPGLRGSRPDPSLDLYRNASAAEEAQRAASGGQDHWRAWTPLPAIGSG